MHIRTRSLAEQLRSLVNEYRAAGEPWPTDTKTMAAWMIRAKKWQPTRKSAIDLLAPQLSRAMRGELFTDPQGRRVRKKHAVRESEEMTDGSQRQHTIWVELDDPTTAPKRVHNAAQVRRRQVLGDCFQLKTDLDSYNENYNPGPAINMLWDFTDDLLEMEQSTEYLPPDPDKEDEDGEDEERV